MQRNIEEIIRHFGITTPCRIEKDITGHINDSFRIITSDSNEKNYFLQWINNQIFKDVEGLMNNIDQVTKHLAEKLNSIRNLNFQVLQIIPAIDGKLYYCDSENQYWRLYHLIENVHSYEKVESDQIAYEGGKAFGIFMSLLQDLPAKNLKETIPEFHNIEKRLEAFDNAITENKFNRVKECSQEIAFVNSHRSQMLIIQQLINEEKIPLRITHNDTKFNNVLFDLNNHATCIVDLDTVMPGSILFDFGDAIRTGANTALEDEEDLSKVDLNLSIYSSYAKGFVEQTKKILNHAEIENLAFSARFMTFIIGLRFLTDFLQGDFYFRTNSPNHNLIRTRVQFRLIECMERDAKKMQEIIDQAIKN